MKSERGRKDAKRGRGGLWISDRWGGFIWLQSPLEPFRPRFGRRFALSVVLAKHMMCLHPRWKPTPAAANKKIETMLLSLTLPQRVNGHFPPFYTSPPHPSFLAFIFNGRPVLHPVPSRPKQKNSPLHLPFSFFCDEMRARNNYWYSYQRSCKLCL